MPYGLRMRVWTLAVACLIVAASAYVVRGPDYIGDYRNGGLHDWLTVSIIYAALFAFLAACCVGVARMLRR